jgi:predicted flavoprotein YhiN
MEGRKKRLVVIGGGAAGFFCAVNAARLNNALEVVLLEKSGKLLSKVKVSGGGRCNVTHACYDIADMARKYPRGGNFVKKAFHNWFTTDTIRWFEERGVAIKAEADGRMFPVTDSSQTIIDCLLQEAGAYGVEIRMRMEVVHVEVVGGDGMEAGAVAGDGGDGVVGEGGKFRLQLMSPGDRSPGADNVLSADYVCIACGGYPKSTMFGWIEQLGHSIEAPVPSLFTFNMPGHPITQLMGVAVPEVQVKVTGSRLSERGPLLITHWGMSGPVVLRLSAWGARELAAGDYQFGISVNWAPAYSEQAVREKLQQVRFDRAAQKVVNKNPFGLPQRLWEYWLGVAGVGSDLRWADLPAREQNKLASHICAGEFRVKGKTTFKEEFVTAGGVRLAEVDPATMQSRKVPGLFFAGEILDVDGITGGFNFQHAWTSGWIAARAVSGG